MVVCHCQTVSDQDIREAVRRGAGSRSEVARACGASLHCGGCGPLVDRIIASEQERAAPALALEPLPEPSAG